MGVIWIIVSIAIAVALAKGIMRARNRNSGLELGFVSHQWIAEHGFHRWRTRSDPERGLDRIVQ
jgi:hypothetical protein